MKERINKNYENLREGKEAYEAPQCEIIEMQNEGAILSASNESFTESDWKGGWD